MDRDIEEKIYSTFSEVASSIGYSPIHGKIIGALLVNGREMPLKDLARRTGYSLSMISLSLDLLELLGVIKKFRKQGDRNLYVSLQGDLLEALKNAITMRVRKSVKATLQDFAVWKRDAESKKDSGTLKSIEILEKEIRRLERYVDMLSAARLP